MRFATLQFVCIGAVMFVSTAVRAAPMDGVFKDISQPSESISPPPATEASPEPINALVPEPAPPSTKTARSLDDFSQECLDTHNALRAKHGSPPLRWNASMARYAARHTSSCTFSHSKNGPYGENLAAGQESASKAIRQWYDEELSYDYDHAGFSSSTGHFTQVVWRDAGELGCGRTVCNGRNGTPGTYWACSYKTGNVGGRFQENVHRPV